MKKFLIKITINMNFRYIKSFIKNNYSNEYQKIINLTSFLPDNCKFTEMIMIEFGIVAH